MNPKYTTQEQHDRFKTTIDERTRLYTTGMADEQLAGAQSSDIKSASKKPSGTLRDKKYSKYSLGKSALTSRLTSAVSNRMFPILNYMFSPDVANPQEDWMLGAWKEQESLSQEARERLAGTPHIESKLLNERIQDENAKQEILNFSATQSRFHIDYYDALFGTNGIMFKNYNDLTEKEKRYGLGYTQSVAHLFKLKKNSQKIAEELIKHNKKFVSWWGHKGPSVITDSVTVNNKERKFPKMVHHGTFGDVFPSVGFWNRHLGTDPSVLEGKSPIESRREMASHFGTMHQALAKTSDDRSQIMPDFHTIRDNPKEIQSAIVNIQAGDDKGSTGAKYYSGFIKSNNPLRLPDLSTFTFDVVLKHLQGYTEEHKSEEGIATIKNIGGKDPKGNEYFKGKWNYEEPKEREKKRIRLNQEKEVKKADLAFPKLAEEFGTGSAVNQILKYAREMMEEDYSREGLVPDDWNMYYRQLLPAEKAEIQYYSMHGLIKFISKDLKYDSIEYNNTVEDSLTPEGEEKTDPSYILFHPWQFKSIYNHGDFSRNRRNFLGSKGKNKYKKVA